MSETRSLFLIGVGFIGGTLLTELNKSKQYTITVLTRKEEQAAELKRLGVNVVQGTLDDEDIIAETASQHEITVHAATADHLESALAVVKGIRQRVARKEKAVYVHTSGTGVLQDKINDTYSVAGGVIYSDDDPTRFDKIDLKAPHRFVDAELAAISRELAKDDRARVIVFMPPLIYWRKRSKEQGIGSGPFNKFSIQIPMLLRYLRAQGTRIQPSNLNALWPIISVHDLAQAYITLIDWLYTSDSPNVLQNNPYFLVEDSNELPWSAIWERANADLAQRGLIDASAPPRDWIAEELAVFKNILFNSRARAVRLRKLGWEAKDPIGVLDSIGHEIDAGESEGGLPERLAALAQK